VAIAETMVSKRAANSAYKTVVYVLSCDKIPTSQSSEENRSENQNEAADTGDTKTRNDKNFNCQQGNTEQEEQNLPRFGEIDDIMTAKKRGVRR
jgi:hypothetical protein